MNVGQESYYKILGVEENASKDEIKKAYRALSLKFHPDRPDGKSLENMAKYQKINEAYEVLGDDEKKSEYDFMKSMNGQGQGQGQMPAPNFNEMNDIFGALFGNGFNPFVHVASMNGGGPGLGPGIRVKMFNMGGQQPHFMEKPTPIIKNVTINMEQVLNGVNMPIDIERWMIENGNKIFENETIYVNIPKGIDCGEIIILGEKGNVANNGIKGDVKIFINVDNNTLFKRQGLDLIYEKKISLNEALCGFSFKLEYINGKVFTINNQPGNIINPGHRRTIPQLGLKREEYIGNLLIVFDVIFPTHLDMDKIQKLSEIL